MKMGITLNLAKTEKGGVLNLDITSTIISYVSTVDVGAFYINLSKLSPNIKAPILLYSLNL